jgi:hypothetical protein
MNGPMAPQSRENGFCGDELDAATLSLIRACSCVSWPRALRSNAISRCSPKATEVGLIQLNDKKGRKR